MKYRQVEFRAGATVEVIRCIPQGMRSGIKREEPTKDREEIRKANEKQAARKLERKINANFKPGDLHVTLTYRKEDRPDKETAQKLVSKFLKKLRDLYHKAGKQLKYILVTEYKKAAIHHHLIVNRINDGDRTTEDYIRAEWKERGSPKYVQLYDDAEYEHLAEYLIKETEKTFRDEDSPVKQRYSCSRNLIDPKPVVRERKTRTGWDLDPKPRKGYYIKKDSLYNGFDRLGFPYQRYIMVKEHPTDADWEPDDWDEGREKHVHRKDHGRRRCK